MQTTITCKVRIAPWFRFAYMPAVWVLLGALHVGTVFGLRLSQSRIDAIEAHVGGMAEKAVSVYVV